MNELTALIHNFNTDCYKQYTKVSNYLGDKLDESLKEIEDFYHSDFWIDRFKKRLYEEDVYYTVSQAQTIIGVSTLVREVTKFKLFSEEESSNGVSDDKEMIALNINMSKEKLNDAHINNIIMHEFGHKQYNYPGFSTVVELNKRVIDFPGLYIKDEQTLNERDYRYFTNDNELRQRIIPIIKEMYDNNWTAEEAYKLSENLKIDDIKDIFDKEYILHLLDNIL